MKPAKPAKATKSAPKSSDRSPSRAPARSQTPTRGPSKAPFRRPGLTREPATQLELAPEPTDAATAATAVEIRRSARRRRTVTAFREGDRTVVCIPARFSRAEEQRWVAEMLDRLARQDQRRRRRVPASDAALLARADELSAAYLGGRPRPRSVRWVSNQRQRWGSCTPVDGTVRLSDRLREMPQYVVDYVLVHELAHLIVAGHGPAFWALVAEYPAADRARGYLEGVEAALGLEPLWERATDADDADDIADVADEDAGDDAEVVSVRR